LVKFVHTADWQLGMGFAGRSRPEELRRERLLALARVLDVGKQEQAAFILAAGDCFESNRVSKTLLYEAKEVLRNAPCPVYILPGNHDPLSQDSIYTIRDEWQSLPAGVSVLRDPRPVTVAGATLYPCPCTARVSAKDPTGWIPARQPGDGVRIGVAHGSWQVLPELPADDYPIAPDAAAGRDLDYLALGHWHSTFPQPGGAAGRTFYSGTHEQASFGERDSGNVLVVEIRGPGQTPIASRRRTGRFVWKQEEFEVRDDSSIETLRDRVQKIDNAQGSIVRIVLKGVVPPVLRRETVRVLDEAEPRFYSLEIDDTALITSLATMDVGSLPSGLMRRVATRLLGYATGEAKEPPVGWSFGPPYRKESPIDVPPGAARRALELLYGRFGLERGPER